MLRYSVILTVLLSTIVALTNNEAHAGDPCPIRLTVINLGPLGGSKNQVPADQDEIFKALIQRQVKAGCLETKILSPNKYGEYKLGEFTLNAWPLQALVTDKKRAFRCTDAHKAFAAMAAFGGDGTVIYQRGSRRVLLSTAGWQTNCVSLSELTGKNANQGLIKLWSGATEKVIRDRHQNP